MRTTPIAAVCSFLRLGVVVACLLSGCGLTPDRGPPVIVTGGGCQQEFDSLGARTTIGGCGR
jgi:hypothetical protein